MNIAEWLTRAAAGDPRRGALYDGTTCVSDYGSFERAVALLAGGLSARGVGPGDRVAIFMKNMPQYLVALFAIWRAGAVAVPINAKLHAREAAWIVGNSGTCLALASPPLAGPLSEVTEIPVVATGSQEWDALSAVPLPTVSRAPDDLAWLFYTSGTTGRPKGVMITHRMLATMSLTYQADLERVEPEDATIYAAPLSHGAGLYSVMHVRAGARHVFPVSGSFDPGETLDLAAHFGRAHMFMAPTMVQRLTRHARDANRGGEGLRTIVYAGGPMYLSDILEATDTFGPVFAQIYGQGECPMGITALTKAEVGDRRHPNWRARLGSVGRAQSAVEVRIDGAGSPGEISEILVRGDVVMPGYWRNPEATVKTLRDGWLCTGDLGSMDADGYVTLKDRSKDLIISGGTNIYPREVEETLLEHEDVLEVAVLGRPHPEWGEDVVAFVVSRSVLDVAALDAHCLDRIARFKRPKAYFPVEELPKNNYGKVLKTSLRDMLATLP
ncbi:AMP-binding protein [Sagittula stellata]|uniref:AMP-binding enzyme n=1 Tax=Sagittula stellata (strain ATCC 700073 / DSM 11524 / E-37) TaxID=388399 RepID=A3K9V7_SAGS3|nr:AMP-binding protein [Sagittula stellata]EBA06060.1 AMP-binding enzyme [Sagittula stellata E-37]